MPANAIHSAVHTIDWQNRLRSALGGGLSARSLVSGLLSLAFLLSFTGSAASAQNKPATKPGARHTAPPKLSSKGPSASQSEELLEELSRALHDKPTGAVYEHLSEFAAQQAKTAIGARAALALGYYDFNRGHYPEARQWLTQAAGDPLLGDYALYWQGLTDHASGDNDAALEELQRYRQRYPDSVVSDSAVGTLAQTAIALNRPDLAVSALSAYSKTDTKSALVLLRAQAKEKIAAAAGQQPLAAAAEYLNVMYHFPLSEEAKNATDRVTYLRAQLGEQFPATPVASEIARAEALYDAKRWADMRAAYRELLPKLPGAERDLALLRLAQADAQAGAGQQVLAGLAVSDPEIDAQRLYLLAVMQQNPQGSTDMLVTVEKLVAQYPQSSWTEQGLFAAGNSFWANQDRDHAAEYYRRCVASFPAGHDAPTCQWRVAWTAYMDRQPDAASQMEQFLRQNPTSGYAVDSLYWLGRSAEQASDLPRARSFYLTAEGRFPQTYFAARARDRLEEIGTGPIAALEIASAIPPPARLNPFTEALPQAALQGWARAQALESISFNGSAELELRADYAQTQAPKLLLAVAQAAIAAGQYPAGVVATRQLVPELEARHFADIPLAAWRTAYPLPYQDSLQREANRNHVDPMLVAGLIRQESLFMSGAVSYTNCCLGLMQILPKTGIKLARSMKVRFTRAQLFDPEYNLALGTHYLAQLLDMYGMPEEAVAAYNAGETRVDQWTTGGQEYREPSEFVECIPFTQTRDYVQIVLRNAELYRRIYGQTGPAAAPPSKAALPAGKLTARQNAAHQDSPRGE